MTGKCCVVNCPFKSARIPLFPFPKRDAPNYKLWVTAMHRANTNFHQVVNPLVCAMHFSDHSVPKTGKLYEYHYPAQHLSEQEFRKTIRSISSINNYVGQWLQKIRRDNPDVVVDDEALKAKARELGSILKLMHVIDYGWIAHFEEYVIKYGIKPWKKVKGVETMKTLKVVKNDDHHSINLDSIEPIDTYKQALEVVKLLEEYAVRTANSDAIELLLNMQQVIIQNMEHSF